MVSQQALRILQDHLSKYPVMSDLIAKITLQYKEK
jgi:hypothetical protein